MYNIADVLDYLRAEPEEALINDIERIAGLLKEKVAKRHISAVFSIKTENDTVYISNIEIKSVYLTDLVRGLEECTVMAATIGLEVDKFIAYQSKISVFDGLLADAVASGIIEKYCDEIQGELTHRYSPGYGDFGLETQKNILSLLNAEKNIGIYLNEESIMKPRKSITAVMAQKADFDGCKGCLIKCDNYSKNGCGRRRILND